MKSNIVCLACNGKGYVRTTDYRGYPMPIRCGACNGTGSQRVGG